MSPYQINLFRLNPDWLRSTRTMTMGDIVDKLTRSRMMSGIKGKNTRPELLLRLKLHRMGFRYRIHAKNLPGKPDIVLPKYRAVIFVHGCFWHRHHGCRYTTTPGTNVDFWIPKFQATIERDRLVMDRLFQEGWRIGVVWECALRRGQEADVAETVARWLRSDERFMELPEQVSR